MNADKTSVINKWLFISKVNVNISLKPTEDAESSQCVLLIVFLNPTIASL
jgi:hypothetical protein